MLFRPVVRDLLRVRTRDRGARVHLDAAMRWLESARAAVGGRGISRSYTLRYKRAHHRRGWLAAYPETVGYIIPTYYDYARLSGESGFATAARELAHWEADEQLDSGAVTAGVIGSTREPAVFNTGQVLFGWAAAVQEGSDERLRLAAERAGAFLLGAQDADGAFRRHGSTRARAGVNVYDARTAWGLIEAGKVCGREDFLDAAVRNLDFVLTRQRPNGWFAECCLDDDQAPLLHTIAYTIEGLLGGGLALGQERFVAAARRAADALVGLQRPDGSLAGRFDERWQSRETWSCLTGDAQMAICWWRLAAQTGEPGFRDAARRMNAFLRGTQDLGGTDAGVRGGIKGAQPIWGDYGAFEYLNWAAKFFADAQMLELADSAPVPSAG
ncbi:MAG: hypothetical protein KDG50_14925 [Chromatiales bacterium]|nr:hypothetical protein [Chromatiales bacterium]